MGNVIESANFWIAILMIFMTYKILRWELGGHLSDNTRQVVGHLIMVFGALGISSTWFAISRNLSPEDYYWNSFMFEWRWLMILITAVMIVWGSAGFIRLIDGDPISKQLKVFFISGLVAFAVGFY